MNNKIKNKVIKFNFKKDIDNNKTSIEPKESPVVDLRKKSISKMVKDLASLTQKDEDLLEG